MLFSIRFRDDLEWYFGGGLCRVRDYNVVASFCCQRQGHDGTVVQPKLWNVVKRDGCGGWGNNDFNDTPGEAYGNSSDRGQSE